MKFHTKKLRVFFCFKAGLAENTWERKTEILLHLFDNGSEGFTSNVVFVAFCKEGARGWNHKTNDRIEVVQKGMENPPTHIQSTVMHH